MVKKTMTIC